MDNASSLPSEAEQVRRHQVDNAVRAIQQKKPLPEIDFTIHTMEDGTQVSTQERVCKGMGASTVVLHPHFISSSLSPSAPQPQACLATDRPSADGLLFSQTCKPPPG
jgi:hypothetical protein